MPLSFVKSLEQQTSNDIKSEGRVTQAVQTELSRASSDESLASITEIAADKLLSDKKPLNARCHSCDDILSASTRSPPLVPTVTISQSQGTVTGILNNNQEAPSAMEESGTLKRASSDTILNSTETPSGSLEDRLTKFTGKILYNLLQVGKTLKQRSSPIKHAIQSDDLEPQIISETETKDTNEDSDSSVTKWPKKLQFKRNVFKTTASGQSTSQNNGLEKEATKNKKREQSKSKIIIV